MDINQLRTFATVAQQGSITRASEILFRSQPAISAHVKCLEETLGIALFDRTPRGMSVTHHGEKLLVDVEELLHRHRRLLDTAKQLRGHIAGQVAIGIGPGMGVEDVSMLLGSLSDKFPDLAVIVSSQSSCCVRTKIRSGEIDAGIFVSGNESLDGIDSVDVSWKNVHLAVSLEQGFLLGESDWSKLGEVPWILPSAGSRRAQIAEQLFSEHRFRPEKIIAVDDETFSNKLVSDGVGIGLIYETNSSSGQLLNSAVLSKRIDTNVRLKFGYIPRRNDDPAILAVLEAITETICSPQVKAA